MTQKIEGKFYPLTPQVSQKLRKANLTAAEWRFWAYLVEVDPSGDRYKDITPMAVMAECEMSKPTYYRAKAKFQELGLFDFQEEKVSFRNLTGFSKMRQLSQKFNFSLKNETVVSEMRLDSQKREIETLQPAISKALETSKTIQTYSDLLDSLSQTVREGFEKFCSKRVAECSFKIGSRKAWLNKHGLEYWEEFRSLYPEASGVGQSSGNSLVGEKYTVDELKRLYRTRWRDAAAHFGVEFDETAE